MKKILLGKADEINILLDYAKEKGFLIEELDVLDETKMSDILNRNDYIATTLWNEEDIAIQLELLGFENTKENVAHVLSSGLLKNLGDCVDDHWEIINQAITNVMNGIVKQDCINAFEFYKQNYNHDYGVLEFVGYEDGQVEYHNSFDKYSLFGYFEDGIYYIENEEGECIYDYAEENEWSAKDIESMKKGKK